MVLGKAMAVNDEPHNGAGPWDADKGEWSCWCHLCMAMREAWPETTRIWKPKDGESRSFSPSPEKGNFHE